MTKNRNFKNEKSKKKYLRNPSKFLEVYTRVNKPYWPTKKAWLMWEFALTILQEMFTIGLRIPSAIELVNLGKAENSKSIKS